MSNPDFEHSMKQAWMAAHRLQGQENIEAAWNLLSAYPSVDKAMQTLASETGRSDAPGFTI